MSIERTASGGVVITGPHIAFAQLLVWKAALRLEIAGMKRRGRSVYAIVKEQLGFTGGKEKVYMQLLDHINKVAGEIEQG